jgi:LDH2 family malate/lactate/ureidoglycolate dehydrogenase
MTEQRRYCAEDVHGFCCALLEKLDVPHDDAKEVGDCLLLADLRGVDSHGVIRLTERVLAPREIESQNQAKNRVLGIPLLQSVVDELTAFGAELNVALPVAETMEARAEANR